MKTKTLCIIIFMVLCGFASINLVFSVTKQRNLYKNLHTISELQFKITNEEKTIVYFYKKDCPACSVFKSVLNDVINENNVVIYGVDIKYEEFDYYDLINKFNLNVTPTMVVFKDGLEVRRYEGAMSKEELLLLINK